MIGFLYVVATPIGNLEDLTRRAIRVLQEADAIICETPMVTRKLLTHLAIQKPLLVWRQRSSYVQPIIERLARGERLVYVTDAGTPGIADPGGTLVAAVAAELPQATIVPVPGSSALLAALSIAGVPADRFSFFGFPPSKKGRAAYFTIIAATAHTVVFYEGPHRILRTLRELAVALGGAPRPVVICRELTKMHESVYRGTIEEVIERVGADPVKGEYTIVLAPRAKNDGMSNA